MPAIPFRAEVSGGPELATLELHGDVNAAADDALGVAWEAATDLGAGVVLLDFSDAAYIHSTGIALIFQITRLSDYMRIFEDATSAATAAAATPAGGER